MGLYNIHLHKTTLCLYDWYLFFYFWFYSILYFFICSISLLYFFYLISFINGKIESNQTRKWGWIEDASFTQNQIIVIYQHCSLDTNQFYIISTNGRDSLILDVVRQKISKSRVWPISNLRHDPLSLYSFKKGKKSIAIT